ncbi:MAG: hypothetical protein WKG06_13640 [Segetibacter sp.]
MYVLQSDSLIIAGIKEVMPERFLIKTMARSTYLGNHYNYGK